MPIWPIVSSGGYEDDVDQGVEFTYTGQGGQGKGNRDSGKKGWGKNSKQIEDQKWERGNKALQMSYELNRPVRVLRGHTLQSPWAPKEGYRYDGLYDVVEAASKRGKSGFLVCLFRLRRRAGQDALHMPGGPERYPMRPSAPPIVKSSGSTDEVSPSPSEASGFSSGRERPLKRPRSPDSEIEDEKSVLAKRRAVAKDEASLSKKLPKGYRIPKSKPIDNNRGEGPSRLDIDRAGQTDLIAHPSFLYTTNLDEHAHYVVKRRTTNEEPSAEVKSEELDLDVVVDEEETKDGILQSPRSPLPHEEVDEGDALPQEEPDESDYEEGEIRE
ncbi:PUA-like domain-containing protein [Crepidotus variabilis]|uniref:PUA-like domain-containing protein n=1 Tax=Crepidotus variabilis TaxID=179855 RepID=A0A9P6ERS0_9AGAR|nr:PUA-like domain-containing protein [Crepidotus variabilis]